MGAVPQRGGRAGAVWTARLWPVCRTHYLAWHAALAAPDRCAPWPQVNNAILYDKTSHEKMMAEVPKFKMITISILSDRLRINCSLARRTLAYLVVRLRLHGSSSGTPGRGWRWHSAARAGRGTTLGLGLFATAAVREPLDHAC